MEQQLEVGTVEAFLAEAKRRRTALEQEQLREQATRIAENRAAWGRVLDEVRGQLPDILRGFVVVTDPDVMDEPPSRLNHHCYIQLRVPLCAPISFEFEMGCWTIRSFWPRVAVGLEEDEGGEPYLRSNAFEGWEDIYIAVATAHEHYPTWRKLEEEVDWWLNGKRESETTATSAAPVVYQSAGGAHR